VIRLSEDFPALKTAIGNLTPVGDTNIPLGLVWGWHLVSPNTPFADGAPYETTTTKKIIVLMSDGENNVLDPGTGGGSSYSGISYLTHDRLGLKSGNEGQRQKALDDRLALLCSNIKARGIRVYTVRLEVTQGTSTVLQNCATNPQMFYDVQSAATLQQVFTAIAGEIVNIRIAK
jgi:hypothetical protein